MARDTFFGSALRRARDLLSQRSDQARSDEAKRSDIARSTRSARLEAERLQASMAAQQKKTLENRLARQIHDTTTKPDLNQPRRPRPAAMVETARLDRQRVETDQRRVPPSHVVPPRQEAARPANTTDALLQADRRRNPVVGPSPGQRTEIQAEAGKAVRHEATTADRLGEIILGPTASPHQHLKDKFAALPVPSKADVEAVRLHNALKGAINVLDRADGKLDQNARVRLQADISTTIEGMHKGELYSAKHSHALVNVTRVAASEIRAAAEERKDQYRSGRLQAPDGDLHSALHSAGRSAQKAERFADDIARRHRELYGDNKMDSRVCILPDGSRATVKDREEVARLRAAQTSPMPIPGPQQVLLDERAFSMAPEVLERSATQQPQWISQHIEAAAERDRSFGLKDQELERTGTRLRNSGDEALAGYVDAQRAYRAACRERDIATDRWEMAKRDPHLPPDSREARTRTAALSDTNRDVQASRHAMEQAWEVAVKSGEKGMSVMGKQAQRADRELLAQAFGARKVQAQSTTKREDEGRKEGKQAVPRDEPGWVSRMKEQAIHAVERQPPAEVYALAAPRM